MHARAYPRRRASGSVATLKTKPDHARADRPTSRSGSRSSRPPAPPAPRAGPGGPRRTPRSPRPARPAWPAGRAGTPRASRWTASDADNESIITWRRRRTSSRVLGQGTAYETHARTLASRITPRPAHFLPFPLAWSALQGHSVGAHDGDGDHGDQDRQPAPAPPHAHTGARRPGQLHDQRGRRLHRPDGAHPALVRAHRPDAAHRPLAHRPAPLHQPRSGLARPRRQAAAHRHAGRRHGPVRGAGARGRPHLRRALRAAGDDPPGRPGPDRRTPGHARRARPEDQFLRGRGACPDASERSR